MNEKNHSRPVIYGEVLFDRFPDGTQVLGGAPFNVAWHLQALGQSPLFVSRIGEDASGREIRDRMTERGMDTSGLQTDQVHPTGSVEVQLKDGQPTFEIVEGAAYDFIDQEIATPLADQALIYHGTLALRSPRARESFLDVSSSAGLPLFLDVNLRAPWWDRNTVLDLVANATWVKLNDDELDTLAPGEGDQLSRAKKMIEDRDLHLLILTKGAKGAIALTPDGDVHEIKPATSAQVVDTVGAGDAFASIILLGLLKQWQLPTALNRAQQLAAAVVGLRGATPDRPDFYQPFLEQWDL